ncbi:MAG: hypothetical protein QXJ17_00465 [Nitrososphaeria archaeon]
MEIEDLNGLLKLFSEPYSHEKVQMIKEWAVKYAIRFLESTGLGRVYTGEVLRVEMYEHPISKIEGFKFLGRVQSLDNKYYNVASVIAPVRRRQDIYIEEFQIANKVARKQLKVPITGPYTLADWSLNNYYFYKHIKSANSIKEAKKRAKRELIFELATKVLRPEILKLRRNGACWIQIDEPALTSHSDKEEMELFTESFNTITEGVDATFSLHNCYSNYEVLSKYVTDLKKCNQLSLEFANRDSLRLGIRSEDRPGYSDLKFFVENGFKGEFGVGVVNVLDYEGAPSKWANVVEKTLIESPELIRDRLMYAAKVVGDPSKVSANPDCGLRTRKSWVLIRQKLENMVKGASMS